MQLAKELARLTSEQAAAAQGVFEDDESIHIVMELCQGGALMDRVKQVWALRCFCSNFCSLLTAAAGSKTLHFVLFWRPAAVCDAPCCRLCRACVAAHAVCMCARLSSWTATHMLLPHSQQLQSAPALPAGYQR